MKINSEHLYKYINELATNEKVKFNVYYDDQYVTQIYWNGESFEWETGTFTSEAFFNPLYDFIPIEEEKKIPERIPEEIIVGKKQPTHRIKKIEKKINEIISYLDYLKSKGE